MIQEMDLTKLTAQLELASSFAERQKLVAAAAQEATPIELKEIARLLNHRVENVRLGAIEILEATRFRPVLSILAAASQKRRGTERVFAARAVARLAEPGDRAELEPVAQAWLASKDELLQLHAHALLAALGAPVPAGNPAAAGQATAAPATASGAVPGHLAAPAAAPAAEAPVPGFGVTAPDRVTRSRAIASTLAQPGAERAFVQGLLDSKHPGVRVDLLQALSGLGAERLAQAAPPLLDTGDGDVVALVARALGPHIASLDAERLTPLREALEGARRRLRAHDLAIAALDECLLAAKADSAIEILAAKVDTLAVETVQRVAAHLHALPEERRRPFLPKLLDALEHAPRRALLFAEVLRQAWPSLRPPRREVLRRILAQAGGEALPRGLPGEGLADIGALYAAVLERGDSPPQAVLVALDRSDDPIALQASIAIHARLATESSARRLIAYLDEPDASVREAARLALQTLDAPHVKVTFHDGGKAAIEPDYRTPAGEPLRVSHGVLEAGDGTRYALDPRGEPVPERATAHGACRCCERPRVLVRQGQGRPTCPITGEAHLVENGTPALERAHPLGGCGACESLAPLARHGSVVRCDTCQTEHVPSNGRYRPRRRLESARGGGPGPDVPALPGLGSPPGPNSRQLPEPPGAGELKLVEPAIAHAMAANVFVLGHGVEQGWTGSGVIVARSGNEVAVLTNRHVIEDQDERGNGVLAALRIYTISGELVPAQMLWRAGMGIDLALLSIRLGQPGLVAVTELQEGPCLVGSRLFSIGNPMGLSWSYASGTLAAFRTWTTSGGVSVRLIQSHVSMSPGSSGGGLYHEQGHLVGINSFIAGNVIGPGGDQSFSIGMASVLESLRRDRVSFAGKLLVP
jgi:S1-C subfamily serine protease